MINDFEVYERRAKPPAETAIATLHASGDWAVNEAAYDLLKRPAAVLLMYSRSHQTVGLKAAKPGDPNAYPVRNQGGRRSFVVAARSFSKYYGIPTGKVHRYPVSVTENGVLTIDLKQPAETEQAAAEPEQTEAAV